MLVGRTKYDREIPPDLVAERFIGNNGKNSDDGFVVVLKKGREVKAIYTSSITLALAVREEASKQGYSVKILSGGKELSEVDIGKELFEELRE